MEQVFAVLCSEPAPVLSLAPSETAPPQAPSDPPASGTFIPHAALGSLLRGGSGGLAGLKLLAKAERHRASIPGGRAGGASRAPERRADPPRLPPEPLSAPRDAPAAPLADSAPARQPPGVAAERGGQSGAGGGG